MHTTRRQKWDPATEKKPFRFAYKDVIPGQFGECWVGLRALGFGKTMVVLYATETRVSFFLERIATQLYRKHLNHLDPERLVWVKCFFDPHSQDEVFQKVDLTWDGERFEIPRWKGKLNSKAFQSVFGSGIVFPTRHHA